MNRAEFDRQAELAPLVVAHAERWKSVAKHHRARAEALYAALDGLTVEAAHLEDAFGTESARWHLLRRKIAKAREALANSTPPRPEPDNLRRVDQG